MADNEKVPYIQCLYHTGKKVYKYWLATLAVIGVIIGFYFVIVSQWKQIENGLTTISNALNYIGYVLSTSLNNIWSLACAVPWYWWVLAGVTIGPIILVAIWCALKHFNVDTGVFIVVVLCLVAAWGIFNFIDCLLHNKVNESIMIVGILSTIWWVAIMMFCCGDIE